MITDSLLEFNTKWEAVDTHGKDFKQTNFNRFNQ